MSPKLSIDVKEVTPGIVAPQEDENGEYNINVQELEKPAHNFSELLNVHLVGLDRFVGPPDATWKSPRTFGGLTIAQGLLAACHTVPVERRIHSLHSYFLLGGDAKAAIFYQVYRTRDGQSFSNRRVQAIQKDRVILEMQISFQVGLPAGSQSLEHQSAPPADIPTPAHSLLVNDRLTFYTVPGDLRVARKPTLAGKASNNTQEAWFRAPSTPNLGNSHAMHCAAAAFYSDHLLLATAWLPHRKQALRMFDISPASLCHSMWFHGPFRADEWMLHCMESPAASEGRGLVIGRIYTQEGKLVSTTTQEGIIRLAEKSPQSRSPSIASKF